MKVIYKKKDRFFLLALIGALLVCVLNFSAYRSGVSGVAASALGFVVTPLQKLASGIHAQLSETAQYFQGMERLQKENAALRADILRLEREISELEPAKKENEMLSAFLELKRERTDIQFVSATVIGRSSSNYTSEFTIDKGSLHGLTKNMPVMAEDNTLLGILVEVGANYARGRTITSYDVSVGVKNERTGQPAILSGSLVLERKGFCEAADLSEESDWQLGDTVRTSGLGGIYPSGLYVGTVTELVPNALAHTMSAIIQPSHSVTDTDLVMVVTSAQTKEMLAPPAEDTADAPVEPVQE